MYLSTEEPAIPELSEKEGHKEGSHHEHQWQQRRVGLVENGLLKHIHLRRRDSGCEGIQYGSGGIAFLQRMFLKDLRIKKKCMNSNIL